MNIDVVDLRDFYATTLGQVAARAVRRKIRSIWSDLRDMDVLAVGYPVPYLNPLRNDGARVMVAMPSRQGVLHWPAEGSVATVLADEWELPFPDLSMDRVLIVHGLETTERLRPMLREAWRVLKGSGRLMIVAPNRRGLWARFERTPFGHGQPFSPRQISRLLRDNLFTPVQTRHALFVPPTHSRMILASAPAWEQVGHRVFRHFSGVILAEATKQIYAGHAAPARKRRAQLAPRGV